MTVDRIRLVRRGLWLNYFSIAYNVVEAIVSVAAGLVSGSAALVGFGIDSAVEVTSSGAAQWRLRSDHNEAQRNIVEARSLRIIGAAFLILAVYITVDSALTLWRREAPRKSFVGLGILILSVAIMPVLARAKHRVALEMESKSLEADAFQTSLCAWLSAIALAGVGLNVLFGWWWADPVAALVMVPIIAKEGFGAVNGRGDCANCSATASGQHKGGGWP